MTLKTAVVTGAASGIGKGYCVALVERGFYVLVTDIDEAGAQRVAEELTARGPGKAEALRVDVADADAVAAAVHRVKDEHGRLDMIFNNAGVAIAGPIQDLTLDHWRKAADVMVLGVAYGVDAAYKVMLEQGFGHIVNTASMGGFSPMPFMAPYSMAKHAVVGMTTSLRAEAAAHGVKVTCVCPIAVNTNLPLTINGDLGNVREVDLAQSVIGKVIGYVPGFLAQHPDVHGRKVMRATDRNRLFVIQPWFGRPLWWAERLYPPLLVRLGGVLTRVVKVARPTVSKITERI